MTREFAGKMTWLPSALPISYDPGRIALNIGGDLVLLELAAGVLLGRIAETSMNDIIDALLLPAAHNHGAHVDFDSQILDRSQRTCDLLTPGSAFAGYVCFLRHGQRRKQGQHYGQPDDL